MSRLVVISNRLPTGDTPSGGLVVALHAALSQTGGCWIGAAQEYGQDHGKLEKIATEPYSRLAFRLTEEEAQGYYLGFANSVLWPLCHRRVDLVKLSLSDFATYESVNKRVAKIVAQEIRPDDILWIHDYHFIPLARELRNLGVLNRIGFFLHIPFPVLSDLAILPDPSAFADCLAHYNLIGLQTRGDVARCLEMFRADPRAEFLNDGTIKFRERITAVRSFPIGIDVEGFKADAQQTGGSLFGAENPEKFVIGVDRLDYTKGLPNRFEAFGLYLERRDSKTHPCLVQIAPPTRQEVQAYQEITEDLQGMTGRINGRFAELDWTPIRFINRLVERAKLAKLYRGAAACLVTSLADGMNLVAKEYIAAQNPRDPGVLILSRFAGAAEDMQDALLVNPYDIDDMADAIARSFQMPLEERLARYDQCMQVVERTDSTIWSKTFLAVLASLETQTNFDLAPLMRV